MDTKEIYEAFGLEMPVEEPAGVKEQEITEPVEDEGVEGVEEQEITEPAEDAERENTEKPVQTLEQRREFAARRRRAEQQAAVDAARAEERARNAAEWEAYLATAGIRDPYNNNQPIRTKSEFDAYQARRGNAEIERQLKGGRMTRDDLDRMVDELPEVKAARQIMQENQKAERMREVDRQFAELQALDPSVQSLEQIMEGERSAAFMENVRRTGSLTDAYKLTFFDQLQGRERELVGRAATARGAGKDHLQKSSGRGSGAPTVTRDRIAEYRALWPNATVEEIRKFEEEAQKMKGS